MECAVVATNIRGSREEVDHDENGYLVDVNNPVGLRNCILNLATNNEKMQAFKKRAREKAISLYDEKKVVETQLQIFNEIEKERSEERRVGKERRDRNVTGVQTCALPIWKKWIMMKTATL